MQDGHTIRACCPLFMLRILDMVGPSSAEEGTLLWLYNPFLPCAMCLRALPSPLVLNYSADLSKIYFGFYAEAKWSE